MLSTKAVYSKDLKRLIGSIGSFLVLKPTPDNITQLLSYSYTNSDCFVKRFEFSKKIILNSGINNALIGTTAWKPWTQASVGNLFSSTPSNRTRGKTKTCLKINFSIFKNYAPYIGSRFDEAAAYFIIDPTHRITIDDGISVSTWLNLVQRTVSLNWKNSVLNFYFRPTHFWMLCRWAPRNAQFLFMSTQKSINSKSGN